MRQETWVLCSNTSINKRFNFYFFFSITSFITRPQGLDWLPKSVPFEFNTAEGCDLVQKEHGLHLSKLVGGRGGKEIVPALLPWKSMRCFTL